MALRLQAVIALSFLICLANQNSFAQKTEDFTWNKGFCVLDTKDTLKGLLKFDFKNNYIEYLKGEEYRIFLPGKFTSFFYKSSIDSIEHNMHVYDRQTAEDFFRPYFFEPVDTTGKIKIVKQFYWQQRNASLSQFSGLNSYDEKITDLYYLNKNNQVLPLFLRKKFVLKLLTDKKELIKEKVKQNYWHYSNYTDVIKIIQYYNSQSI